MSTFRMRGAGVAALALAAVALAAGPAQARGGLKAQTAELILAQECGVLAESCDANANASAVTAYSFKFNPGATSTVWTAIAANLMSGETYHLFNRASGDDDCSGPHLFLPLDENGNLLVATTLGQIPGEPADTVDICRNDGGNWIWILTGQFTGGASSGGKNKNK